MGLDRDRAQKAVTELLEALGENPSRPGLVDTPRLVADALADLVSGIGVDPADLITALEPANGSTEPIVLMNIATRSLCEHHLMPFIGIAHVAYVPGTHLTTLGSLTRVVETLAAKPQIQERLGEEIADALEQGLQARGVLVVLDMAHHCVTSRGSRQASSRTLTIASRGQLAQTSDRAEVMALIAASEVTARG